MIVFRKTESRGRSCRRVCSGGSRPRGSRRRASPPPGGRLPVGRRRRQRRPRRGRADAAAPGTPAARWLPPPGLGVAHRPRGHLCGCGAAVAELPALLAGDAGPLASQRPSGMVLKPSVPPLVSGAGHVQVLGREPGGRELAKGGQQMAGTEVAGCTEDDDVRHFSTTRVSRPWGWLGAQVVGL